MTGFLLFLGAIALLAVALEVTHRRAAGGWRPGLDTRDDRDRARLADDLRAAAQREEPSSPLAVDDLAGHRVAGEAWRIGRQAA
ncbi:MAG: hypothetical protein LCH96_10730 [Actinobacteria bacterium]|nr:hypothetical protein [Actinomycetota bacterium]